MPRRAAASIQMRSRSVMAGARSLSSGPRLPHNRSAMDPNPPAAAPGRSHRHRFEGPFWRRIMLLGIRHFPAPLQRATMPLWAGIFYALVPTARRTVEANLDRVLGPTPEPLRRLRSFRLFVNYAQSIANMYGLYLGRELPVEPTFVEPGRAKLRAVLKRGNGIIIATGHLGFWSLGPFLMERFGLGAPVVAMA